MDFDHRVWDHRGGDSHIVRLNAGIIAASLCLYVVGHLLARGGRLPSSIRSHGFDVLATPVLLGLANLMTILSPFRAAPFVRFVPAIAVTVLGAAVWEGLAPLYSRSTRDPIDLVAYATGLFAYLSLVRIFDRAA